MVTDETRFWGKRQRIHQLLLFTETGEGSCPMACTYCEPAGTRLLTGDSRWVPIEDVKVGDTLIGFGQNPNDTRTVKTRFKPAVVTGTATRRAKVYRIKTDKGDVRATGDHLWFMQGNRWRRTDRIRPGQRIRWVSSPIDAPDMESREYKHGYIVGAGLGDGTLGHYHYDYGSVHSFRLAVQDAEIADRFSEYMTALDLPHRRRESVSTGTAVHGVFVAGVHRTALMEEALSEWVDSEQFYRGFLAGMFDAEGSYDGQNLRIHNGDEQLLERTEIALNALGVEYSRAQYHARTIETITVSNTPEVIRFVAATQPACSRKLERLFDRTLYGAATVLSVEPDGVETVYSVETTAETYIAEGFASHNCFLAKSGTNTKMEKGTIYRAIDFLREVAVRPPSLHFFGTEPLKNWELIVAAREYAPDMPISMTTNGQLLSRRRVEWLNENDVKIYVFSLDGGEEHNAARVDRRGRPTWPVVTRNLKMLLETEQRQWLTVRATWWPSDYDLVSRFKALMDLGASSIQIVPVTDAPFDEEQVKEAYLALGEYYGWGWTPSNFVNDMIKRCKDETTVPQAGNGCGVGTGYWAVSPDGSLSLCQLYEERPEVGSIGDIWQGVTNPLPLLAISDRVGTFHTDADPYPKRTERYDCSRCHAYKHCMGVGWCAGLNLAATGDELVPPDGYCAHLRGMVAACREWAQKMAERIPPDQEDVLGERFPVGVSA